MNNSMIVRCPHCSERMSVPPDYAGLESKCPKCRRGFVMLAETAPLGTVARATVAQPPVTQMIAATPGVSATSRNMRVAGWICFWVGMVLLILCPILPFYSPFFLVSVVLAIVLLVRDEGREGLVLLLMTLLLPVAVGAVIFMLGVGAALSAFSGFAKELVGTQENIIAPLNILYQEDEPPGKYIAASLNQLNPQQPPVVHAPAQQAKTARQFVFQPPAKPVQPPPAVTQLPAREVTYDDLLLLLNRYGIEFKSANTSFQKQDIRLRAQKESLAYFANTRMTLAGTVSDVQYASDGKATLTVGKFEAAGYFKQKDRRLFIQAYGRVTVPLTREEALAVKSGQKIWITGQTQLSPIGSSIEAGFKELTSPSFVMLFLVGDGSPLLKLRLQDYTVRFKE